MTIVAVFPPYVYSIRYGDGEEKDEFSRLLGLWTDVDYLSAYFETNCSRMDPEVWGDGLEPEIVANHALKMGDNWLFGYWWRNQSLSNDAGGPGLKQRT